MTKGAGRPRPRDTADRDSNGSYDRIMAANDTHVMAGHVREHHEAIDALTAEEMLAHVWYVRGYDAGVAESAHAQGESP
jgi:hypothetical protein